GLGDGQDVRLSEGASQRGTAVSAGAEGDPLIGVRHVRSGGIVLALEPGQIDRQFFWNRLACEPGDCHGSILPAWRPRESAGHLFWGAAAGFFFLSIQTERGSFLLPAI